MAAFWRKTLKRLAACVVPALLLPVLQVSAVQVRVATYNVRMGVGLPGSEEFVAVAAVLERMDADIVAFQELSSADRPNWEALVGSLGYGHTSFSSATRLSGNLNTGFASRWPVLDSFNVVSPEGANEITRPPFRTVVDVPGALRPLVLWTLHHKALSGDNNQFRRAVEARRCRDGEAAYLAAHPEHDEVVILGDFNDDIGQAAAQAVSFSALPSGLPQSYSLGADITLPISYRTFPRDAYTPAGPGMHLLPAFQEDSSSDNTFITSGRLDYLFVSTRIASHPDGAPRAEVYNSARDDGVGGLPKADAPLPSGTSAAASDHYPVFGDLHMEDENALAADGVGKAWRYLHFGHFEPEEGDASRAGDDPDDDGLTNLHEFLADTQPTNAASRLVIHRAGTRSDGVELHFHSSTGRLYTVEYRDEPLHTGSWKVSPGLSGAFGNGGEVIYRDDTAPQFPSRRMYRIRAELPPLP